MKRAVLLTLLLVLLCACDAELARHDADAVPEVETIAELPDLPVSVPKQEVVLVAGADDAPVIYKGGDVTLRLEPVSPVERVHAVWYDADTGEFLDREDFYPNEKGKLRPMIYVDRPTRVQFTLPYAEGSADYTLLLYPTLPDAAVTLTVKGEAAPMLVRAVDWNAPNYSFELFEKKRAPYWRMETATVEYADTAALDFAFAQEPASLTLTCWDMEGQKTYSETIENPSTAWTTTLQPEGEWYAELKLCYADESTVSHMFRLWDGVQRRAPGLTASFDEQRAVRAFYGAYTWNGVEGSDIYWPIYYNLHRNRKILQINEYDTALTLQFDQSPEAVVAELWPAWTNGTGNHDHETVTLTPNADGSWSLPVTATEALQIRINATYPQGEGRYCFAIDPAKETPYPTSPEQPQTITVSVGEQSIEAKWFGAGWKGIMCGSPGPIDTNNTLRCSAGEEIVFHPPLPAKEIEVNCFSRSDEGMPPAQTLNLRPEADGTFRFTLPAGAWKVLANVIYPQNEWEGQLTGGYVDYYFYVLSSQEQVADEGCLPVVNLTVEGNRKNMLVRRVRWAQPNWGFEAFSMDREDRGFYRVSSWLLEPATVEYINTAELDLTFMEQPERVTITCWDTEGHELLSETVESPGTAWHTSLQPEGEWFAELEVEYPSEKRKRIVSYAFRLWDGVQRQAPSMKAVLNGHSTRGIYDQFQWDGPEELREDLSRTMTMSYGQMTMHDAILYTDETEVTVDLYFDSNPRTVTAEIWPATQSAYWQHEPAETLTLRRDWYDWTLPLTVDEAKLIRITADFDPDSGKHWGTYLFAVDPMREKPEVEVVSEPPDLRVTAGEQEVTLPGGLGYWEAPGSGRWACGGIGSDEDGTMTLHGSGEMTITLHPAMAASEMIAYAHEGDGEAVEYICTEAEDGSFFFTVDVSAPLRVWITVEHPVNPWVGQTSGGMPEYTLFLEPTAQ